MKPFTSMISAIILFVFVGTTNAQTKNSNSSKSNTFSINKSGSDLKDILSCLSNVRLSSSDKELVKKAEGGDNLSQNDENKLADLAEKHCSKHEKYSSKDILSIEKKQKKNKSKSVKKLDRKTSSKSRKKSRIVSRDDHQYEKGNNVNESVLSQRIFDMGEGVSSGSLIGAWEVKDACIFDSGFEGGGLCATLEDIQEYISNIHLLVRDNGTGFFDADGEREEISWTETSTNGLQVDIGDDDFGQFQLSSDGILTISDDFGAECLNENDELIEGITTESECTASNGYWEKAASMVYLFVRLPDGEFDEETGSRILSSEKRSWWKRAKRRARKAARKAAESAKRAAEAQARKVAEAAAKAAQELAEALEKEALNLAKSIAKSATSTYNAQINLAGDLANQLTNSPAYASMANILASNGTPTIEQFSSILDECDLLGQMMEDLNKKGMKSFFVGVAGSNSVGYGDAGSVNFAVSIGDMLKVWDDIKQFREPSLVPNMAIQFTKSQIVGTQYGTDADIVFGWNTDEPQNTYGDFWDFSFGVEALGGSISSSSAIAAPIIKWNKVSGGRYLGQGFSVGKGAPLSADLTFGLGNCCILHINNNMKHKCN